MEIRVNILIANIAWIDNGWVAIDNQTISGHRHVRDGGIAHESLNFKFDGEWNDHNNIYGFCQFTNPPKIEGNDNVVVFYSKNKIVGIYMNVELGNYKPEHIPSEIESFNLKASRINSFKLDEYIKFNPDRHLPVDKKKIGHIGFTYINKKQLINILNDICTLNANLFSQTQEILKTIKFKEKDMNIWIIAPGEEASIWGECRENGYIAIGWDKIDVNEYTKIEDLKKKLIELYYDIDEKTKKHNYLWNFGKNIKVGDIVVARNGRKKIVGIGEIASNYISPNTADNPRSDKEYKQVRYVNWFDLNEYDISGKGEFAIQTVAKLDIDDKRISKYIKKVISQREIKEKIKLLEYQKQIILQGPPGTGKTRLAKQMARYILKDEIEPKIDDIEMKEQVKLIQFHPSYSYEDFVRGIVADLASGSILYKTENKILADMAKKAKEALGEEYYQNDITKERKKEILEKSEKYILIIDEINRANLSSVFGELIYALEYRDETVESMYELNESRKIILPSNLYIIGTMNTADRSIGHIDYAIRRRFTFLKVLANEDKVLDNYLNGNKLYNVVNSVFNNKTYISPEFDVDDIRIGHSYFIADNDDSTKLAMKFIYQVLPLLIEYVKDGILINSPKFYMDGEPIYLDKTSNDIENEELIDIDENDIIDFLND